MTLGLTRDQVAKAVATFPHLLGYSIEETLQPKVEWLMTLGLTRDLKQDRKTAQLRGSHGGQVSKSVSWLLLEFNCWIVGHAINLSFSEHNNFMILHDSNPPDT